MQNSNRTSKVLVNAKISLLFFVILLLLSFVSRSIFIKYLGTEILGLHTIVTNLVGFLNLAELGISAAIASALYKPILDNNKDKIKDVMIIQGWLYRKIGYLVIVSSGILMCFFPIIFEKTHLPLWYAYSIFFALVISSLLTYFINYKQILLVSDMKEYKVILCVRGVQITKLILQILAITYFENGFVYWVFLELCCGVFSSYILKKIIDREYPWLNIDMSEGLRVRKENPEIITHTKQLFFHKFAGFVLMQTTPLIIYAYVGLKLVAIYDNYMMIILGIIVLINAIFSSFQPAIGNLVANGDKVKVVSFFYEFLCLRFWIASIICVVFFFQVTSFVILWVGENYIIENTVFYLLVSYLFIALTRVFDPFIYAFALYNDIYAPIVEAVINLGLSIVLGYFFGLPGILCGVIISLLLVICIWRPYYVFKFAFESDLKVYFKNIFYYGLSIIFSITVTYFVLNCFYIYKINVLNFLFNSLIVFFVYSFVSALSFYLFFSEFRQFILRIFHVLKFEKFFKKLKRFY